jgi:NitT/TauT family transport system substrate-binding protein
MKRPTRVALAAAGILTLAACSSAEPEAATPDESGLIPVTVGVIPIVDTAPIWLGDSLGFFEDAGLDLTIQTTTGGAASVPGVVAGDYDFAFGNLVSVMVAADQGLDLKFVANGASTTGGPDVDFGGVVVPADSPIQTPADLAGATVSVNNLANIGDTTVRSVVEQDGGDPTAIDFIEVAFPDAPAALENGQVDAAWILDPFLTTALDAGARVISWNYVDFDPELDIAGYFTLGATIESDPDLVDAFAEAMNESLEYAAAHPDEVREIVSTYTEIDPDVLAKITLPSFRVEFSEDAAAKLGAAAAEYGTLTAEPDLSTLLP